MSLRINHNISAINSHRNLIQNTKTQAKNLERLSSGLKINRGADAPAGLIISERLRAQVAGLNQAIDNSEAGISLMQTAEGALEEVNRALINIRQLTVASANEATNDDFMLEANQEEILNSLQLIDRISRIANYGKKAILDGSMGANGITTGDHLEFIEASVDTQTSPVGGYDIMIKEAATRSMIEGSVALSTDIIDREEQITLVEGGKTLNFVTTAGDTVETTMNKLEKALKASGLNIEMLREPGMATEANQPQFLAFRHKEYGSEPSFQVASNTAGLLSANSDVPVLVQNGIDVAGTIGGEFAQGEGQVLTGSEPTKVSGIQIKYTGDVAPEGVQIRSLREAPGGADDGDSLRRRNIEVNATKHLEFGTAFTKATYNAATFQDAGGCISHSAMPRPGRYGSPARMDTPSMPTTAAARSSQSARRHPAAIPTAGR